MLGVAIVAAGVGCCRRWPSLTIALPQGLIVDPVRDRRLRSWRDASPRNPIGWILLAVTLMFLLSTDAGVVRGAAYHQRLPRPAARRGSRSSSRPRGSSAAPPVTAADRALPRRSAVSGTGAARSGHTSHSSRSVVAARRCAGSRPGSSPGTIRVDANGELAVRSTAAWAARPSGRDGSLLRPVLVWLVWSAARFSATGARPASGGSS